MGRLNVGHFRHPDGTSDKIMLADSGQVGVGTASPGAPLSVQANSTAEGIEILGRATDDISEFAFLENDGTTEIGRIQARTTELHFRARQSGQSIVFAAGGITESARIDSSANLKFNSGYGSVTTAYGVRAWVQFQGSNGTINANGNVSSITRNSTGNYTVNFATAMPDDDYAAVCSSKGSWNLLATHIVTTSSVNVLAVNQSFAYSDHTFISLVIVR